MGDALQRVLNGVGEVVHGVDAPLVALAVVVHMADAVEHRVAHIEVAGGQVDLGPQGILALGEFSGAHPRRTDPGSPQWGGPGQGERAGVFTSPRYSLNCSGVSSQT